MKSNGKHLHFFAIISDAVATLRGIIVPLGFGFVWGVRHLGDIIGYVLIIPLVIVVFNFFKWLRFKYEFVDDQFHIRSGVLVRSDRYIRIQRIQSVQIKTNLLLRLLGVVQLKFDTADQASKGDTVLSALKLEEAERIKAEVSRGKTQQSATAVEEKPVQTSKDLPKKIYLLSGKRLLAASLLSSKIGVMIAAVAGLWSQADDFIPDSIQGRSLSYLEHASLVGIIIIIGVAILLFWLFSLVSALLRWGFFKLSIYEEEWCIHRGVWETSDETYKTDRVQAIRIKEQWFQQLFGWCTVYADCSGSIDLEKSDGGSILVFPLLRKKELPDFLKTAIPRFSGPIERHPLPMRGTLYRMILPAAFWIVLCSVLTWWLDWGKYTFIAFPFILAYIWFKNRSEGWALIDKRLIVVNRWLTKTTTITTKQHIQSFAKRQSRFQKKLNLSTCKTFIRASTQETFTIHQLDEQDADRLFHWFRKK
ncbi:PH domain-containing protein [Sporolactobacillus shoreicorticis]|uniref:PH domain-containing protein n=1 Tax=Sporolactobacillus shoreicorticis TaxID=1923877 RepID=A0ABW5S7X0_9BACL|nr:PH domain-containing protein [Sporolactobacillus shoreicorticis]MCO7125512.1 PH domain-containing protein [Sporolactobacillus shoreicorticis]